ncbi:MAG: OpgC domain-containing protein [marine benthic group bacterium]|nr:OpgC domain-containing protein [Gemmatimonadota bacterium]MCL7975738.1 OpgC domain-containing protein [Gemmatimonadota bacterium]MCL7985940.1 OpgC domain-containing protein [Gemmatimonadota bacterium]
MAALGTSSPFVQLLVRTATPTFIFMFGMMLELVYARRARDGGMANVSRRLLLRSAQCYVGYQLTVVAAVLGGWLTAAEGADALLFLGKSRFGNILRFYSVAMLLAIPILHVRLRVGPRIYGLLLAAIWLGAFALRSVDSIDAGSLTAPIGILFGIGEMRVGPSVWHGMTLTLAGMLIATGLEGFRQPGFDLRKFYRNSAAVVAASLTIVIGLVATSSLFEVAKSFAYFTYRSQNHVGYYAIGLIAAAGTLILFSIAIPLGRAMPAWTRAPLALGTSSLLSFTAGNVALNLMPAGVISAGSVYPVLASLAVIGAVMVLVSRPAVSRSYRFASRRAVQFRRPPRSG